jgi:uncharacterized protein (TIGR00369 family)
MLSRIANKIYGTVATDMQKEMTGLEFVQGLVDGTLPLNMIAQILGYDITEAESGRVVISAEPNETLLNPAGTVHGGFSATLLDSCMGLAILSILDKGVAQTTLEFKISLMRPITPLSGASAFLVADCGIDALILGHRLVRVEADFVVAPPQRFCFGEKEESPT